ncbi:MAG: hypothetical protein AB8B56_03975 [Crocinitomicaceae bacterium]
MKSEILRLLCYFDVFNHPLSRNELKALIGKHQEQAIQSLLDELLDEKTIYSSEDYFGVRESIADQVKQRTEKEERAKKYYRKLPRYLRMIKAFPFVRGVGISGSLSKNVMHEDGDIDYFIVTAPGRLWICRTLLVLFKKVFLLNSRKYFCVNYFVDEHNLEIADKNIFTAIEVSYLMPVYNTSVFNEFSSENSWTKNFINGSSPEFKISPLEPKKGLKRVAEFLFYGAWGDRIDLFLMKRTYKRWEKKFKGFDTDKFELTMRTNRGVSKHHPRDFQSKVLREYNTRLNQFGIES